MQSENTTKKFYPRETAVAKLYSENVRLQELCAAHRKHLRHMQKALELLKTKYELATTRLALLGAVEIFAEEAEKKLKARQTSPVQMETAKVFDNA